MAHEIVNFAAKLALFEDRWSPKVIAEMNDYQFKLAKIEGEFVWHRHEDTDEAFVVLDGEMSIELRDDRVDLKAGEMFVVPRGIEHKPRAARACSILLIEPRGVINTGDRPGELTAATDVWI